MTDGLYGGAGFVEGWVGWEGRDASFVIDLDEIKEIHTIETDFLHQLGAWVLLPVQCRMRFHLTVRNMLWLLSGIFLRTGVRRYSLWE